MGRVAVDLDNLSLDYSLGTFVEAVKDEVIFSPAHALPLPLIAAGEGAEKEWKHAKSNMEAASSSFVSASNELSIASVKAKSASGDLQITLLEMRDSASEASLALSSYVGIIGGHSALTSECGSMLEEKCTVQFIFWINTSEAVELTYFPGVMGIHSTLILLHPQIPQEQQRHFFLDQI